MPKFCVLVTRDTTMSTEVIVEAPEGTEPRSITAAALKFAADNMDQFGWELDDGVGGDPYLGDPDCAPQAGPALTQVADTKVEDSNA